MKKILFLSVLFILLVNSTSLHCQTLSIIDDEYFSDAEDFIEDGTITASNLYTAYIIIYISDENAFLNSISFNISNSISEPSVSVYISDSYDEEEDTFELLESFTEDGDVTVSVEDYKPYIKIESNSQSSESFTYLSELSIEASYLEIIYAYDDAGNRISRNLVTTSLKSTDDSDEDEFQKFTLDNNSDILIYPNPTPGLLNIEITNYTSEEDNNIRVKVYSVNGTLILENEFFSGSFSVDLSEKQNGTYLMDMSVNSKNQYFTIIKK